MFLAGALSCSLIVGNSLPIIYCVPDGGAVVCGGGQVCAPRPTGTQWNCVPQCPNTACPSDETCDPDKHWCVPVGVDGMAEAETSESPVEAGIPEAPNDVVATMEAEAATPDAEGGPCIGFGCRCSSNAACDRPFACVDKQAITGDIWDAWIDAGSSNDAGFCAKPCCTSGDCDPGDGGSGASVCFATGAGGNYCVPSSLLGDRSSTMGTAGGGENCMGSMCRSGLCLDSGVCADTCCSANGSKQCANGTACLFGPFQGGGFDSHESANCAVPPFAFSSGMACMQNSDCRSNLCVGAGAMFGSCQDPCRSAGDCLFSSFHCEYLQANPSMSPDIVAACVPGRNSDAGVAVCFVDDQNSSSGDCQTGERCRPQQLTVNSMSYSVLACGM